jgi:hypothetical protein
MTSPVMTSRVSWRRALASALRPRSLARTVPAALVVGTTLWFVNLSGTFFAGGATSFALVQTALTFVIPWLNATFGMTMAFRASPALRRRHDHHHPEVAVSGDRAEGDAHVLGALDR